MPLLFAPLVYMLPINTELLIGWSLSSLITVLFRLIGFYQSQ